LVNVDLEQELLESLDNRLFDSASK